MSELPSGTVTFLFTDIEGSTALERQLRERYAEVLGQHQAIVREAFAAHGGHEIDTQGDSFFFVFPRAKAAVHAAVEAQRALGRHTWPEDGEVRVRMGISTGEASLEGGRRRLRLDLGCELGRRQCLALRPRRVRRTRRGETIPVGDHPVDLAVGEGAVWVVNGSDHAISRIDPETNQVVATIELENEPVRIAADEGAVWVTVQEAEEESD